MPMIPMDCAQFPDRDSNPSQDHSNQQQNEQEMTMPKTEPMDSSLGVKNCTKFKKEHAPNQAAGWLAAMVDADASGFILTPQPVSMNSPKDEEKPKGDPSAPKKYYPAPFCSCTGTKQQCYRWGNGGWQSACCTTKISMYPLPMNPKKKGSRVAGRKMSAGAFQKLLDRLQADGVDVSNSVDLRNHWAKHGTNRYVTIK